MSTLDASEHVRMSNCNVSNIQLKGLTYWIRVTVLNIVVSTFGNQAIN